MSRSGGRRGGNAWGRGYGGDHAGSNSNYQWSGVGRGGGGKGGRTAWSFVPVCDEKDSLGLWGLSQRIPDAWIDWQHGGKRKPERMHATVLLKMEAPTHLPRLKGLARTLAPTRMTVRELFCEPVERITDAEVYAIGVGLACPDLRWLKEAWNSEEPEHLRKIYVPYDTDGHITLAYIRGEFRREAESFVEQHRASFEDGRYLLVDSVTYQDEFGKDIVICLEGPPTSASVSAEARVSKGARFEASSGKGVSYKGGVETPKMLEIDGSVLEGGGQILRMSSAYAAIFNVPIHIVNIRAGRKNPGLAAQHLESLRLVRDVSAGVLANDFVGSVEVSFRPGLLSPGNFSADPGTAGSITLMVQASLFPLLFTGGGCFVDLKGGTDVAFSPPLDFLRRVLLPSVGRMGATFSLDCRMRGFFPRGGGHVLFEAPPLTKPLRAIDLSERGIVVQAEVVLHTTRSLGADEFAITAAVRHAIGKLAPEVLIQIAIDPADRVSKYWIDVVVSTATGALFHSGSEPQDIDGKGNGKKGGKGSGEKGFGSLQDRFVIAAKEVSESLKKQLASGAAVNEHLADQLILPASLAQGTSRLLVADLSLHAQTAIHIAELIVPGVRFKQEKRGSLSIIEIQGIGHTSACMPTLVLPTALDQASPPKATVPPSNPNEETFRLGSGSLSRANAQLIADFRTDMGHLSAHVGAEVSLSIEHDCLFIRGGPHERSAAKNELSQILAFYKISIA